MGAQNVRTLSFVTKSHVLSSAIWKSRITFGHEFFFSLEIPLETTAFHEKMGQQSQLTTIKPISPFSARNKKMIDSAQKELFPIRQQLFWTKSGRWLRLDDGILAGVEPDFCTTNNVSGEPLVASVDGVKLPTSKYDAAISMKQKKALQILTK